MPSTVGNHASLHVRLYKRADKEKLVSLLADFHVAMDRLAGLPYEPDLQCWQQLIMPPAHSSMIYSIYKRNQRKCFKALLLSPETLKPAKA